MANKDKLTHLMKLAAPFIAGVSGDVNAETVDRELQALLLALETHKGSTDHDNDFHVWSALNRFLQTVEVAGILPISGDTADIGAPTRLFRKGYFSELSSLILRKENVLVMDGTFVLTKQSGKFAADVGTGDTQVDFGQAMTQDYLFCGQRIRRSSCRSARWWMGRGTTSPETWTAVGRTSGRRIRFIP